MISRARSFVPRNSRAELQVLVLGRISTEYQDARNIEASYRYVQDYLRQIYDGPMNIRFLGEQASGMRTDRQTIREAEDLIASGQVDLVIAEDLSRIYRNPRHQYDFVQDAVDAGTRVICIGDNLDTADENWEVNLGAAALRHGLFIPDTRRRIRRTATHSFHNGGMVQRVKFGYRKLTEDEAKSGQFGAKGLRIAKVSEHTPVIRQMRDRLLDNPNFSGVADWLNDERVAPGPSVRNGRWTGKLVADLMRDPLLSGTRRFRQVIYRPIFQTGKHRREKNESPETVEYPELAHLDRAGQEELWRVIGGPEGWKDAPQSAPNPRAGVPRSRATWPGQAANCSVCGGQMWQMGRFLKCENALKRHGKTCWNHVHVPVALVRQQMLEWILQMFDQRPDCRSEFLKAAWEAFQSQQQRSDNHADQRRKDRRALQQQAVNLTRAIADGGQLATLLQHLRTVEARIQEIDDSLEQCQSAQKESYGSFEQVAAHANTALHALISESFEFAEVLRRYFPRFEIQLVQALDSGLVRPRGKLWFQSLAQDCSPPMDECITLDFFDPPEHIAVLKPCLTLRSQNPKMSYRQIGAALNVGYMTVKRCLQYARRMEAEGQDEPYRVLTAPPQNAPRWR